MRARIPASCSAFALGFAVPGNLPSVEKPNKITWTNQPGSKVAKCDLRGEGLAEEGPGRGRDSRGWSSSTKQDEIPFLSQKHAATLPDSQQLAPTAAPREAPAGTHGSPVSTRQEKGPDSKSSSPRRMGSDPGAGSSVDPSSAAAGKRQSREGEAKPWANTGPVPCALPSEQATIP